MFTLFFLAADGMKPLTTQLRICDCVQFILSRWWNCPNPAIHFYAIRDCYGRVIATILPDPNDIATALVHYLDTNMVDTCRPIMEEVTMYEYKFVQGSVCILFQGTEEEMVQKASEISEAIVFRDEKVIAYVNNGMVRFTS